MKFNMRKAAATALAVTMCVPFSAFAAQNSASGSFNTSFDVYSPALTISVPLTMDVRVNPIADTAAKDVKKFAVASNSIDIMNASVDVEKDVAIPVNVTVKANISTAAEGVVTEYNTFAAEATSTKKKIYLELSQANKAATLGAGKDTSGAALTPAFDTDNKLDLSKYAVATAAEYDSVTNKAAITKYGSLLSMDITGPTTTNSTTGKTYSTAAADVTAAVGSFAVTGVANTNADWKANDVAVAVTYNVRASKPLSITTPTLAAGVTVSAGADASIVVPNVGEAEVVAFAVHNDEAGYKDYVWTELDRSVYEITYAPNATTTTQTDATIKIDKADPGLVFLADAENGCKGKAQDLIIALSDGRYVVSTFTAQ